MIESGTVPSVGLERQARIPSRALMKDYRVGAPMDRVATDLVGPFPVTENGNRYIVVIGDYFTKWIEAYAIPDFQQERLPRRVFAFFSRFGIPLDLHTDVITNLNSSVNYAICWRLIRPDYRRTTRLLKE